MTECVDENRLVWFLRGELSGAPLEEVEEHLDDCVSCRDLFALVAQSSLLPATVGPGIVVDGGAGPAEWRCGDDQTESVEPGTKVGRFTVTSLLGSGGMGVVYAARDDELDRTVALKLLRPDAAAPTQDLLRAEAQALAQLAHPNVIAVYDVGVHGDRLFVAIEYVDGTSLAEWCTEPRTWHATLDVARQAGQGLAAAHAAGLVHRDVKPANIRIGRDGRVRVLDFGLAQRRAVPGAARTVKMLAGTPAYMAPEQVAGAGADARSDQFSFCLTLYEALYGERPFSGLASAGVTIRDAPVRSRVPGWLRRVLVRGLSPDPGARYPDMERLLAALGPPRRRRVIASVTVVAMVAAIGIAIGVASAPAQAADTCTGAGMQLASVWNEPRRRAIQAAFLATGKPFAADTWHAVEGTLDRYAHGWAAMHTETCEATHVRAEQSAELLDLRMQCLAEQLQSFDALTRAFSITDPAIVARAAEATEALPSLQSCADGLALRKRTPLPTDPSTRREIDRLHLIVAQTQALYAVGKYRDGIELLQSILADVRRTAYGPLEAAAILELGLLETDTGTYDAASHDLRDALRAALAANDDHVAARIAVAQVTVETMAQHYAEALERAKDAAALIEHAGGDAEVQAALDNKTGTILAVLGRLDEAAAAHGRALAFLSNRYGADDFRAALVLDALGGIESERGHADRALEMQERALASARKRLGNAHPIVAGILANVAGTLNHAGRYEDALARWQDSLAIRTTALRPDHPMIAENLASLGMVHASLGHPREAREYSERALAIYEHSLAPETPAVAYCHAVIADSLRQEQHFDDALVHARRANDILEKTLGPDSGELATGLDVLGHILADSHRFGDALPVEERAAKMMEHAAGPENPNVADPLTGIGEALLGLEAPERALAPLVRADHLQEVNHSDPADRTETQFALARALWQTGGDRTRARELAKAADAGYASGNHPHERADVEAWLASH